MKRYFIKQAITGEPVEYYGRESGWTTDKNKADGYLNRYTAEDILNGDPWLEGAYISCETVKLRSEIILDAIRSDMRRLQNNIDMIASIVRAMDEQE